MSEAKPIHALLAEHRKRNADRLTCVGCGCDLGFPSSDPYADPDCACCAGLSALGDDLASKLDTGEITQAEADAQYEANQCPTLAMLEPLAAREPALPPEPPATEFEVPPY